MFEGFYGLGYWFIGAVLTILMSIFFLIAFLERNDPK